MPTTVSQNSQFPKFDFQAIFISETKFVMKCCFNSVDENNYSKISVTIPPLNSCRFTAISCDSFTCNCNIRVLNNRDYIMLTKGNSPITIYFEDYTNLNSEIFAELLNSKLSTQYNISCFVDHCNRLYFISNEHFYFNDISYNVKLLLGLYSYKDEEIRSGGIESEEITSEIHKLQMNSVGYFLSTPILNLVSNIGDPSFRNNSDDIVNIQSCNTVLRINNSFSPNIPIIAAGNGSTSIIPSGSVSGAIFILVDANMHQIDLLNPMYITLTLEPILQYE